MRFNMHLKDDLLVSVSICKIKSIHEDEMNIMRANETLKEKVTRRVQREMNDLHEMPLKLINQTPIKAHVTYHDIIQILNLKLWLCNMKINKEGDHI